MAHKQRLNLKNLVKSCSISILANGPNSSLCRQPSLSASTYSNMTIVLLPFQMLVRLQLQEVRLINSKLFDNACRVAKGIPGYKLRFRSTGGSWNLIEKVIFGEYNKR